LGRLGQRGNHSRRQGHATFQKACPKLLARCGKPTGERSLGDAELLRGLGAADAIDFAQNDRRPMQSGQVRNLFIEERQTATVAPGRFITKFIGRMRNEGFLATTAHGSGLQCGFAGHAI